MTLFPIRISLALENKKHYAHGTSEKQKEDNTNNLLIKCKSCHKNNVVFEMVCKNLLSLENEGKRTSTTTKHSLEEV